MNRLGNQLNRDTTPAMQHPYEKEATEGRTTDDKVFRVD